MSSLSFSFSVFFFRFLLPFSSSVFFFRFLLPFSSFVFSASSSAFFFSFLFLNLFHLRIIYHRFRIACTSFLRYTVPRACLKNHFRNLQAPLCGIFYPHSVAVARYAALIRIKSPTNWDSQLTKSLFQTRSRRSSGNVRTKVAEMLEL